MLIRYKNHLKKLQWVFYLSCLMKKTWKGCSRQWSNMNQKKIGKLFLWKEGEDIIGLVGVTSSDQTMEIQHISVNPSHRHQGIGKTMIKALDELYPGKTLTATDETESFLNKCDINNENKEKAANNQYSCLFSDSEPPVSL